MNRIKKRNAIVTVASLAAALACLALGLPGLEMKPGMPPLALGHDGRMAVGTQASSESALSGNRDMRLFLAIAFGLGMAALLAAIIKREGLKDLRPILSIALRSLLVVGSLLFVLWLFLPVAPSPALALPSPRPAPSPAGEPLGPVPRLVYWLLGLGLAGFGLLILFQALRRKNPRVDPAHLLGLEAKKAKVSLLEGEDVRAVILRCYRRMCAIFKNERNVEREGATTAEEFVAILEAAGAPPGRVRELTRIFEAARYSAWEPLAEDGDRMLAYLDEVIGHVRSQGEPSGRDRA